MNEVKKLTQLCNKLRVEFYESASGLAIKINKVDELAIIRKFYQENKLYESFDLIPVSGLGNPGFACDILKPQIRLELQSLDKIYEYDETNGTVIAEPGVTYYELFKFLSNNGSNFKPPSILGSEKSSIVANILQGGVNISKVLHYEVVEFIAANGAIVHSIGKKIAAKVNSLFIHNENIIVTKLKLYLSPIANFSTVLKLNISDSSTLCNIMTKLKLFIRDKIVDNYSFIFSKNYISALYVNIDRLNPVSGFLLEGNEVAEWVMLISIEGSTKVIVEEKIREFTKKLVNISLNNSDVYSRNSIKELLKIISQNYSKDYYFAENEFIFQGYTPGKIYNAFLAYNIFDPLLAQHESNNGKFDFINFRVPNHPTHIANALLLVKTSIKEESIRNIPLYWQILDLDELVLIIPLIYDGDSIEQVNQVKEIEHNLMAAFQNKYQSYRGKHSLKINKLEQNKMKKLIDLIMT